VFCFISCRLNKNTGGHVFWVKSGDEDVYPDAEGSKCAVKRGVLEMAHVMHGKIDIAEQEGDTRRHAWKIG
jgi:hypothetical protein